MSDVLERLHDLHKQATTERSHFYVAKTCELAIAEIENLRDVLDKLARLGNEPEYGNSDGNRIAQAALLNNLPAGESDE